MWSVAAILSLNKGARAANMTNSELRSDLNDTKSDVFSFGIWFIS